MGRQHTQNQGRSSDKRMGSNPGTFSPDEAQDADRSSIDDQPDTQDGQQAQAPRGRRRQAQGDGAGQPEQDVEQAEGDDIDDEDAENGEVNTISQ